MDYQEKRTAPYSNNYNNQGPSMGSMNNMDQNYQQYNDPRAPASNPSFRERPSAGVVAKSTYAQELQEQIRMKQDKKYKELLQDRQQDMNLLRANMESNPFGKQGAGAPLRDVYGNIDTTKTKALNNMYTQAAGYENRFNPEPGFSLKARLARENIVSQSVDGLNKGYPQNNPGMYQPQGGYPGYNAQSQFQPPPFQGMGGANQSPFENVAHNRMYSQENLPVNNTPAFQDVQRRPNISEAMPFPQAGNKEDDKQKKVQVHMELQNALMVQMEEKKQKKAMELARKKMEDQMEDERVRRENEIMLQRDLQEAEKKKNAFQNFQADNQKLATNTSTKDSGFVVESKKGKPKRVRTPIETIEQKVEVNLTDNQIQMQQPPHMMPPQGTPYMMQQPHVMQQLMPYMAPMEDFPVEVARNIKSSIEYQLQDLRKGWDMQQVALQEQLIDLKKQLVETNNERSRAHNEVHDLKLRLRDQQIAEEIRRTELYDAILKGQTYKQQPSLLPTITRLEVDRDPETTPFEFPRARPGQNLYNMKNDDKDALDAMLAAQSKIINPNVGYGNHGRLVERANSRPGSALDGSQTGLEYLNYYNNTEDHTGIRLDNNIGGFSIPDYFNKTDENHMNETAGLKDTFNDILRKNNERLDILEDIEHKNVIYGSRGDYFQEKSKRNQGIDDELYQMMKSESVEDDLLEKINNPRRYVEDYY